MTKTGSYFTAFFILLLTSCTGSKNIADAEEKKEEKVEQLLTITNPYYQEIFPGTQDGAKGMVLFLPCTDTLTDYVPDSVYFKGYHEALTQYQSGLGKGYRARVRLMDEHKPVVSPMEIKEDEAVISLQFNDGKKRYVKVEGVTQAEAIFMP